MAQYWVGLLDSSMTWRLGVKGGRICCKFETVDDAGSRTRSSGQQDYRDAADTLRAVDEDALDIGIADGPVIKAPQRVSKCAWRRRTDSAFRRVDPGQVRARHRVLFGRRRNRGRCERCLN